MFELNKSIEHIAFSINVFNNPANLNKYGTTQDTLIVSGTNNVYKSSMVCIPDTSFGLTFVADNKNFEYIIQMFDDNGNLLTEDPLIKMIVQFLHGILQKMVMWLIVLLIMLIGF